MNRFFWQFSITVNYINSYTLCLNMTEVELKEWGNSIGVILPRDRLNSLGLKKGDKIEIEILVKKKIEGFGISKGAGSFKKEKETHEEFW